MTGSERAEENEMEEEGEEEEDQEEEEEEEEGEEDDAEGDRSSLVSASNALTMFANTLHTSVLKV